MSIELGRIIERGMVQSRALDKEALCVISGENVWTIRCDSHVINDDGNIIDAMMVN